MFNKSTATCADKPHSTWTVEHWY